MGSEQGKLRPAIVLQHNSLNKNSNTTIVVPITSKIYDKKYPMHVLINGFGLDKKGTVKVERIRSVDKKRIVKLVGIVNESIMQEIKQAFLKTCDYY